MSNNGGPKPVHLVESAELLFNGDYTREGFDLVITGNNGEQIV
ncbi:MAG: hypothetical protein ACJAX5_003129, partial [Patiriisocius sp.]